MRLHKSLLDASNVNSSPLERRKRRLPVRWWNERRRKIRTDVGLEISSMGISIAFISGDESGQRKLTTDFRPFQDLDHPYSLDSIRSTLQELVDAHRLQGQSVSVALGGEACITRTFYGVNDEVDANCRELCERSSHFLALGLGNKIHCQSERAIDAKRKRAWVTIAQHSLIENVSQAIEQAGLRLWRIEHTITLLCEIVGHSGLDATEPVLLVLTSKGQADLTISYRGQLLLDYRPFQTKEADTCRLDMWSQSIRKHLKCLQRFLSSQLPAGQDQLTKICMPGTEWTGMGSVDREIQSLGMTAVSLPLENVCDGLAANRPTPSSETMAAIWACRKLSESSPATPTGGDLFKSFRPEIQVTPSMLAKLLWPIALVIGILGVLYSEVIHQRIALSSAESRLDEIQGIRMEAERLRGMLVLDEELVQVSRSLKSKISALPADLMVKMLGRCLPEGTWLRQVTLEPDGSLTVGGTSYTSDAIYDYVAALKELGCIQDVNLAATRSVRLGTGPAFEFEISGRVGRPDIQGIASAEIVNRRY